YYRLTILALYDLFGCPSNTMTPAVHLYHPQAAFAMPPPAPESIQTRRARAAQVKVNLIPQTQLAVVLPPSTMSTNSTTSTDSRQSGPSPSQSVVTLGTAT